VLPAELHFFSRSANLKIAVKKPLGISCATRVQREPPVTCDTQGGGWNNRINFCPIKFISWLRAASSLLAFRSPRQASQPAFAGFLFRSRCGLFVVARFNRHIVLKTSGLTGPLKTRLPYRGRAVIIRLKSRTLAHDRFPCPPTVASSFALFFRVRESRS